MVTIVVVFNLALALMLLCVAWRVRRLGLRLARYADRLAKSERKVNAVLSVAPNAISTGRLGIHKLRNGNQPLELKLLRIQQVLTLLGIGQQIWQRSRLVRGFKFLKVARSR